MVDWVKFLGAVHFSLWQFSEAAGTYHLHRILCMWNSDTKMHEWDSSYQVRLILQV
jgi:hypothetical protein